MARQVGERKEVEAVVIFQPGRKRIKKWERRLVLWQGEGTREKRERQGRIGVKLAKKGIRIYRKKG